MMTSYLNAAQEIHRDRRRQHQARSDRDRALRPVRIIDVLISSLEELHLEGKKRVPTHYEDTLVILNDSLPEDLRQELRSRVTIAHLMDRLYDIQDRLFSRLRSRDDLDEDYDSESQGQLRRAS